MKLQTRNWALYRFVGAIILVLRVGSSLAAGDWEDGDNKYHVTCGTGGSCHSRLIPPVAAGTAPALAGKTAQDLQTRINLGGMGGASVEALATSNNTTINDTVSNIAAYLNNLNYPKASLTAPNGTTFGSVSMDLTRSVQFSLTNSAGAGHSPLTFTASVRNGLIEDTTNFDAVSNNCGSSVVAGTTCTITVTFRPGSDTFFSRTLRVAHNAIQGVSTVDISGTGLPQFTVSPLTLTYPEATTPPNQPKVTITDNKGDRLRICRANTPTFNFPADYSLDAPYTLGGDGCFTTEKTLTVPRKIELFARFTDSGIPLGQPRNGALTIQRVDDGGNALGNQVFSVQLLGNPGALAKVEESSLFDRPGDPGVEVDHDNTLDRSVTLYSRGSKPLVFTASTFKIGGATSAAEYEVMPSGCAALPLSGLAAWDGLGSPPNCVLTVRFNPSDVELRAAILTIAVEGSPQSVVALNGRGFRGPRLAPSRNGMPVASGDVVQFGPQTMGRPYLSIDVTLANGGTLGNLEVVLPSAGSAAGFSHVAGMGCASVTPTVPCTVDLRFDPTAELAYASPFTIRTRQAGSIAAYDEFVLNLHGQGTAAAVPVLSWTDPTGTPITRLDFAVTDSGAPRMNHVRLYNAGPGGAVLQLANVVGLEGGHFVLDASDCGSGRTLYEKTSCDVAVQFAPGTAGLKTAALQFASDGNGPGQLVVIGTGIAVSLAAQLSVVPQPAFELTIVGDRSLPSELTLSNSGNFALTVNAIEVDGPFAVEYRSCPPVPFVLAAATGCAISATFVPVAAGAASGTLRVITDASAGPTELPLSADAREAPDLSSGGCSMVDGYSPLDPTLWTLALLAVAALAYRRRCKVRERRAGLKRRVGS